MLGNTKERWGSVQIGLHWSIAALILLIQFPAGLVMGDLDPGPTQNFLYNLHKNVGLIVLILATIRVVWRLAQPVPVLPADLPRWQLLTAHTTHILLYLLIFMLPITGFLYTAMGGFPVPFLMVWELSGLVAVNKPVAEVWESIHTTLPWLLVVAVALHVAGALQHHLVRKDGVLRRMLSSKAELPAAR